jgi:hypothetical protein
MSRAGCRGTGLQIVVDRCRSRGYEPVLHNETGSHVESPEEIDMVLSVSDIGLCLDTGHLLIGGGDPVAAVHPWAQRITHVHVKDVDLRVRGGRCGGRAGHGDLVPRGLPPPRWGRPGRRRGAGGARSDRLSRLARGRAGHPSAQRGALRASGSRPVGQPQVPRRSGSLSAGPTGFAGQAQLPQRLAHVAPNVSSTARRAQRMRATAVSG